MSGKPAARLSDPTACPIPFHLINPIAVGSPDVLFDGLPAARQGDPSACGGAMVANLIPNVLINGKPAVVVGSVGSHGNVVVSGSGTVVIGNSHTPATFTATTLQAPGAFELCVQVLDKATGHPIPNVPYVAISADGTETQGVTDAAGCSQILGKSNQRQEVHFTAKPRWVVKGE
ncbi:PAAR domain-containing protein [Metapseudomonas otitidis]|uniref:PAAR domain-containing protein n=1 Tax=Metapseudomonas otitidis TaxID=319939 RepID=UPI00254018EB|nr:PAAR domain-containing protein [Pseudomonas otitidis]WIF68069.1 PAAR domain-containing protein [Pseudomonas otitidis]